MDEPTNHLDMQAIQLLADHLKRRWPAGEGALLVVTHDRWFLDEVCEHMWEVHDREVTPFEGGYSAYIQQRCERDRQAAVMEERRRYVEKIAPQAQEIYRGISRGKEELSLSYAPSPRLSEGSSQQDWIELFKTELRRTEASDVRSGFTSVGPHRDDLEITLGGLSARMYGSQGQQRSAVLALKLAEAQALSQLTGETPIVLLDDVMSELDQSRQDYLLNHLHGRQVFITCCSPETVSLQETGMRFRVEAGEVFPEEVERAAGL